MNNREFFEGVRALLVDKDKNPKWSHKHVNEVKKEEVDFFFNRPETLNLDISKVWESFLTYLLNHELIILIVWILKKDIDLFSFKLNK